MRTIYVPHAHADKVFRKALYTVRASVRRSIKKTVTVENVIRGAWKKESIPRRLMVANSLSEGSLEL